MLKNINLMAMTLRLDITGTPNPAIIRDVIEILTYARLNTTVVY